VVPHLLKPHVGEAKLAGVMLPERVAPAEYKAGLDCAIAKG
jgi:hypothetical protein